MRTESSSVIYIKSMKKNIFEEAVKAYQTKIQKQQAMKNKEKALHDLKSALINDVDFSYTDFGVKFDNGILWSYNLGWPQEINVSGATFEITDLEQADLIELAY